MSRTRIRQIHRAFRRLRVGLCLAASLGVFLGACLGAFMAGFVSGAGPGVRASSVGVTEASMAAGPGAGAHDNRFVLRRLHISPSAIFTDEDLAGLRSAYEGQTVTVEQLFQVVEHIDSMYVEKGFIAKALLPEQTIKDGVVEIHLVEARVGRVTVAGGDGTRPAYVTKRLGAAPGALLSLERLDEDITYFNRTNDAKLQAELAPGAAFGTSDIIVYVQEPKRNTFHVGLAPGGTGSRSVTGTVTWQNNSLSGNRDSLSVTALRARSLQGVTLSYDAPVTVKGTRLGLLYSLNLFEVLEGDGKPTGMRRESGQAGVSLSHPLQVGPAATHLGTVEWHRKVLNMYVEDELWSGNENEGYSLGYTVESQGPGRVWTLNQGFRFGTSQVSSKGAAFDPVSYQMYTAAGQAQWVVSDSNRVALRGGLQFALGDTIPDDEDFALGGENRVRGIKEGTVMADDGYFVSFEYRHATVGGSELFAFLEHGGVAQFGHPSVLPGDEGRTSVGFGMEIRPFASTVAKFVVALPLGEVSETEVEPFYARLNISF